MPDPGLRDHRAGQASYTFGCGCARVRKRTSIQTCQFCKPLHINELQDCHENDNSLVPEGRGRAPRQLRHCHKLLPGLVFPQRDRDSSNISPIQMFYKKSRSRSGVAEDGEIGSERCPPMPRTGRLPVRSAGPAAEGFQKNHEWARLPARPGSVAFPGHSAHGALKRKALFGSRHSGRRESGAGASALQAQGPAVRALLGTAQAALLRETERATQTEEGSRDPPRTAAAAANLVSSLRGRAATAPGGAGASCSSRRSPSRSCVRIFPAPPGA